LEYATPNKRSSAPLLDPTNNVLAAVFMDVMGSSVRAGELLGVPRPKSDEVRNENQRIRKSAGLGRQLLHHYYGKEEWEQMVARMRGYLAWWDQIRAIEDPKEQVLALVAKANGTSVSMERDRAEADGFGTSGRQPIGWKARRRCS
jgi:hypothetical protein